MICPQTLVTPRKGAIGAAPESSPASELLLPASTSSMVLGICQSPALAVSLRLSPAD